MLLYYFYIGKESGTSRNALYMPWTFGGIFYSEDVYLRYINGIIPINVRDCYGKILELVAFNSSFKLRAGRESNSEL